MDKTSKIAGFTSYDDQTYPNASIHGDEEQQFAMRTIVTYIQHHGLLYSGQDHQNAPNCVPVFSDGTALRCSMRLWGSIMAKAYEDDPNNYMGYYMEVPGEAVYPEEEASIKPDEDESEFPLIMGEDYQLMLDAYNHQMVLATTDKAILACYGSFVEIWSGGSEEEKEEEPCTIEFAAGRIDADVDFEIEPYDLLAYCHKGDETFGIVEHPETKTRVYLRIFPDGQNTDLHEYIDRYLIAEIEEAYQKALKEKEDK